MIEYLVENHEAIRNLGLLFVATLGLFLMAWRAYSLSQQASTAVANHITEMYSKSIEQLGSFVNDSPTIEIRIGAIFALEKIALNNRSYYYEIFDVLSSYIRMNSQVQVEESIRPDIQAALTVIGRRPENKKERVTIIDLTGANLKCAKLNKANFEGVILDEANLIGSQLLESNFKRASIKKANLSQSNLTGSNFTGSNLALSDFSSANLTDSIFAELKPYKILEKIIKTQTKKGRNTSWKYFHTTHKTSRESKSWEIANIVGTTFDGADCYGVDFDAYHNHKGIVLPENQAANKSLKRN